MQSTDKSVDIAKKFGAVIHSYPDKGYVEPARNFAIKKAKGDWILILDADEVIPDTLKEKILQVITGEDAIYRIPRRNIIFGHWMEHTGWWPDYQIRLFKSGLVTWTEQIHGQPILKQKESFFPAAKEFAITHFNYPDVESYIDRLNRYTKITATQTVGKGARAFSSSHLYSAFSNEAIYRLFAGEGIKDGPHGVSLSLLQGMYKLVIELKQWEKNGFKVVKEEEKEILKEIKKWRNELNYRIMDWEIHQRGGISLILWNFLHKVRNLIKKEKSTTQ